MCAEYNPSVLSDCGRARDAGKKTTERLHHKMTLKIYNTLTRQIETFRPLDDGHVRMYTCGPTVYDYAHIGNFRAYVFEDLLRRCLRFNGYAVTQVMNLTDVDDKTIRAAHRLGVPLAEYTQRYKEAFFQDIDTLRIERAEYYPSATDHIQDMIDLIERLVEKGNAYLSEDGSVYFRIDSFPQYGKLSRLDKSGLKPGARVSHDEYEKENIADFALWKAWDESDGDVGWDSPWGRGRPGWHIECSAMSMKYLGESFDIHTGGVDNIFPHHEDEIAQSEAATGKQFVRYWLHCAHLIVDGRKMSKSYGNFYTLRQILERGFNGREVRYVLLSTHYRQPLNFTFGSLMSARRSLERLDEFMLRLQEVAGMAPPGDLPEWARAADMRFRNSLNDDLNISEALAAVYDLVHDVNKRMDAGRVPPAESAAVQGLVSSWDNVLAVFRGDPTRAGSEVKELLRLREEARRRRDWKESDRLRGWFKTPPMDRG